MSRPWISKPQATPSHVDNWAPHLYDIPDAPERDHRIKLRR
jgi:hypothetical protein